jgi:hypothetical protein
VAKAHNVNDLVVHSEERDILWRSLRERALASGRYQASDLPEVTVDPLLMEFLGSLSTLNQEENTHGSSH